jgi:hypothetical protein
MQIGSCLKTSPLLKLKSLRNFIFEQYSYHRENEKTNIENVGGEVETRDM